MFVILVPVDSKWHLSFPGKDQAVGSSSISVPFVVIYLLIFQRRKEDKYRIGAQRVYMLLGQTQ